MSYLGHLPHSGVQPPHSGRRRIRMTKTPDAERQRASRQARKAAGLVRIDIWCRPEDAPAIRAYARELAKRVKRSAPVRD